MADYPSTHTGKQIDDAVDAIEDLKEIVESLADVAQSGDYNDLYNKPSIPNAQVQSNWTETDTNDPAFINNKPQIPSPSSRTPYANSGSGSAGTSSDYARGNHVHPSDPSKADKADTVNDVSYDPETGKFEQTINNETYEIATVDEEPEEDSTNPVMSKGVYDALQGKVPTSRTVNNHPLTGNVNLSASDVGADNVSQGQCYGVCSGSNSTRRTVSVSNFTRSNYGVVVIRFNTDVPAGLLLNINSTGDTDIYYKGSEIQAGVIKAGDTATFIFKDYYHLVSIDRWGSDLDALAARVNALESVRYLLSPTNGISVYVGKDTGSGVSKTIAVRGVNLSQPLSVSVSGTGFSVNTDAIPAASANSGTNISVSYEEPGSQTAFTRSGTLTISSSEVNVSIDLSAAFSPQGGGGGDITPEL